MFGIEARYEIRFMEIGTDGNHVHLLVQSVPKYSVTKLVRMIKSLTAREIFQRCPQVKKQLRGGEFWSDGYFSSTVGKHGDEKMIQKYVHDQGKSYNKVAFKRSVGIILSPFKYPASRSEGERSERACLGVVYLVLNFKLRVFIQKFSKFVFNYNNISAI